MCYLPPGPRCSNHASEALRKAEQAYFNASDVHNKMRLWEVLEEAQNEYYSTPRGQNELFREIALLVNASDRDEETDRKLTDLRIKARKGQILRTHQMEAYSKVKASKETVIKEALQTGNKQTRAAGIVYDTLIAEMPEKEPHIHNSSHISMFGAEILVIPAKLQMSIGVYDSREKHKDDFLHLLMRNNCQLNTESKTEANRWVVSELRQKYTHIASVDVYTEKVKIVPVEELAQYNEVSFKSKKKLGGTSYPSKNDLDKLVENLHNTCFEGSVIDQRVVNKKLRTFVLYDKPVTVAADQHLQDFYLKVHRTDNGDMIYEARKKHVPHKYDVLLVLKRHSPAILSTEIRLIASSS